MIYINISNSKGMQNLKSNTGNLINETEQIFFLFIGILEIISMESINILLSYKFFIYKDIQHYITLSEINTRNKEFTQKIFRYALIKKYIIGKIYIQQTSTETK